MSTKLPPIDDDDPRTDAANNAVIAKAIDKAIENDPTCFTTRSFTVLWNEGHSVRLINRNRCNREAISIPWDEIDALVSILRPVNTALKGHLNELAELERVANATRRGSDLAVYKTALDDVRVMIARRGWAELKFERGMPRKHEG